MPPVALRILTTCLSQANVAVQMFVLFAHLIFTALCTVCETKQTVVFRLPCFQPCVVWASEPVAKYHNVWKSEAAELEVA
jgi:hypothetical protein